MADFCPITVLKRQTTKSKGITRANKGKTQAKTGVVCRVFTLLVLMSTCIALYAEGTRYQFDIPAGEAGVTLNLLAQQSRTPLLFPYDEVRHITTNAVIGDFTLDEAISLLLWNTGLQGEVDERGVLIITNGASSTHAHRGADPVTNNKRKSWFSQILTILAGAATVTSVSGQGAGGNNATGITERGAVIEEIVVTAQKREQNLQEVGISISSLGSERLENEGAQSLNDMMGLVPGVTFSAIGPGQGNLVIRGIASAPVPAFNNNLKESVGVYINDTPVSQANFNTDIGPFDLERIEVLRGPQGTLYGSGSLSGTVRYITKKPDKDGFAGKVAGEVSSTDNGGTNYRVKAMVNLPLSETFALRVVGYNEFDDGFIRGVGPVDNGGDENDSDRYGARVAARWTPTSKLTADASVIIQRTERDIRSTDNPGFAFSPFPVGDYEQYRVAETFADIDSDLYNLSLNYELGWGTVTSSTSYLDRKFFETTDFNAPILFLFGIDVPAITTTDVKLQDWSQELRIATNFDGPLNFVGGLFYLDNERKHGSNTPAPGFDAALSAIFGFPFSTTFFNAPPDTVFTQSVVVDERQIALFGELTYDLTERISATLGLRWFDVEQDFFLSSGGPAATGQPPAEFSAGEDDINPKFMLTYALSDDVLLSAQAARGFRLGGTNEAIPPGICGADLDALGLTSAPESFSSESVWNYEIGAKTTWLDNRLVVNGSVYYIEYDDVQITTSLTCGFPFIDNTGKAEANGVEIELTAIPFDGLELNMSGTYNDAELSQDVPTLNASDGDQLPLSSKYSFNATARYEFPVTGTLDAFVQYNYLYNSKIIFHLGWEGNAGVIGQPDPAYSLHNVRLGMKHDRWTASLFLNNAFDEKIVSFEDVFFGGVEIIRSRNQPRTIGFSVSADF